MLYAKDSFAITVMLCKMMLSKSNRTIDGVRITGTAMPYTNYWLIEKKVLLIYGFGSVTADEINDNAMRVIEMMDSGTAPVHAISYQLDVHDHPKNLSVLRAAFKRSVNQGYILIVDDKQLARYITSMIAAINKAPTKAFNTLREALIYLQRVDLSLPPLTEEDVIDIISGVR
jgi:hypothetical protein